MRKILVVALSLSALVTLAGCSHGSVEVAKIDETYACVRELRLDTNYLSHKFAADTMPREIKVTFWSNRAQEEWERLIFIRTGRASTYMLDEGDVMMVPMRCPSDTRPGELVEGTMRS